MFTLNLEFQRNRTGTISDPVNMPTALERAGDFSQTLSALITIYDPIHGQPVPRQPDPGQPHQFDVAARCSNYYPNPNLPFAARNYQTSWTGATTRTT